MSTCSILNVFWDFSVLSTSPTGSSGKTLLPNLSDSEPTVDFSLFSSPAQHCSLGPGRRAVLQPASRLPGSIPHTKLLQQLHLFFFFPWSKMWLTPNSRHWTSVTEMHECFLPRHLVLFPPLCARTKLKRNLGASKKHFSTTCGCYSSSEPITARVIISSSRFGYRFSAYPFLSYSNEANLYFFYFEKIFVLSEVGKLQCKKRNPAPVPQSLGRHGFLWSLCQRA